MIPVIPDQVFQPMQFVVKYDQSCLFKFTWPIPAEKLVQKVNFSSILLVIALVEVRI